MSTLSTPEQRVEPSPRLATAFLRGNPIQVPCPSWCVIDHAATNLACVEDLSHEGEPIALPVPGLTGPGAQVLRARLAQWPFADDSDTHLSLEATADSECAELPGTVALAFTDQVVAHAHALRDMVSALQGGAV